MNKVRIVKIGAKKPVRQSAAKKVFRTHNGRRAEVYVVDSTSKSFDADLVNIFKANVAKARQENTAIFGSPDGPKDS